MRVALDGHRLGHFDAADARYAAGVIAPKVEQLYVLGALLFIGQQLGSQRLVFTRCCAAFARAGNRPHSHGFSLQPHKNFRRCADDVEILEIKIEHVGRGIE